MPLPGRLQLAPARRPILKLGRLSGHPGVELSVKGDDLSGLLDRLSRLLDGAAPTGA